MNIRYKNELLVVASVIFLLSGYLFKYKSFKSSQELLYQKQNELVELKKVVGLQRVWSPKRVSSGLENIRRSLSPNQVKWDKRGKKLTAKFKDMTSVELNKIINKILNVAIEIEHLNIIKKQNDKYTMELKCKW
jgi:hypothetical protein